MTALPSGIRAPRDRAVPQIPYRPEGAQVTVGQTFAMGWLLARDGAAGTLQVVTEVTGLLPGGWADRDFYQAAVSGDRCLAEAGVFSIDMSALSGDYWGDTDGPAPAYGIDNNTMGKLAVNPSSGAARSVLGLFLRVDPLYPTTKALIWLGPEGVAMANALQASQARSTRDLARVVFTSIDSGTTYASGVLIGPSNTAISTQDGKTVAVNDILWAQKGQANLPNAKYAGPWQIIALGSGSSQWKAVRPWWYATGSVIPTEYQVKIGPEGTGVTPEFANTTWKAFCAPGCVVDTDDPLFFPQRVAGSYTAASGVVLNGVSTYPIRSATLSAVKAPNQGTASHASTVGPPRVTAITAGAIGTSALTIKAESAPGTTNASDVGVYTVEVTNW